MAVFRKMSTEIFLVFFCCRIGCNPVVGECDGTYMHESRRNQLVWSLPLVDATNKSGSLEFNAPRAIPNDFFPVAVNFTSKSSYASIKVCDKVIIIFLIVSRYFYLFY